MFLRHHSPSPDCESYHNVLQRFCKRIFCGRQKSGEKSRPLRGRKNWLGKRDIGEGEGEGEGENAKYKMGSVGVRSGTKISSSAGGIKGGEVER